MSRWQELAARIEAGQETCANRVISANSPAAAGGSPPNGPNDTIGTASLPAHVVAGLGRLRDMAAPRIANPEVWPEIVADAMTLARDGWARVALGLGWSAHDLWGVSPAAGGVSGLEGLAIWLRSRRPVLLDSECCIAADGGPGRAVFTRRPADGRVLLWELGRCGR